jgi:hypothetical protein
MYNLNIYLPCIIVRIKHYCKVHTNKFMLPYNGQSDQKCYNASLPCLRYTIEKRLFDMKVFEVDYSVMGWGGG